MKLVEVYFIQLREPSYFAEVRKAVSKNCRKNNDNFTGFYLHTDNSLIFQHLRSEEIFMACLSTTDLLRLRDRR